MKLKNIEGLLLCSECENQLSVEVYLEGEAFFSVQPCVHCNKTKVHDDLEKYYKDERFHVCSCPDKGLGYGDQCMTCSGYTQAFCDDGDKPQPPGA